MDRRRVLAFALLLVSVGAALAAPPPVRDARVRIVSPVEGQQFRPGAKVSIVVDVAASLRATDGLIAIQGLETLRAKQFLGTRFSADFVIPEDYAGPLTLSPNAFAGDLVSGPEVTIKVRPRTPPKDLIASQRHYFSTLPTTDHVQMYAKGRYADGVERDLSSSAAGTIYASSNPAVVSVDREGSCTVIGSGIAVITIDNGGVRDFVTFAVDGGNPFQAIDLSDQVAIQRGSLQVESNPRVMRTHHQQVTIKNTTALPLPGPLFLEIFGLPERIITYGGNGRGRYQLTLPRDGLSLAPAESVAIDLDFLNQGKAPIEYTAKVYHGRVR